MSAKHKARELKTQFGDNAKYVVSEILDELKSVEFNYDLDFTSTLFPYWQEVKSELEKL